MKPISIYIHIPFCRRKCRYCDFTSFQGCEGEIEVYLEALLLEIARYQEELMEHEVVTLFIGGGTPSLLSTDQIKRLFEALRHHLNFHEDPEITIEVNPESITEEKAICYLQSGINRVSIGLQSATDSYLKLLGRIHSFETFKDKFLMLRKAGFKNINIDCMFGLPGQSIEDWRQDLETVIGFQPEHISAYSLIIEPGTPLDQELTEGKIVLPDEETERDFYWMTHDLLKEQGYEHYEISNFAKKDYPCKHNCVYWDCGEYIGFGISAASYYKGFRFTNTDSMRVYMEAMGDPTLIHPEVERINQRKNIEEYMFLGLRVMKGVSFSDFYRKFSLNMKDLYGDVIKKLEKSSLIEINETGILLSQKGIDLSNSVLAEFLLEDD